MAEPATLPTFSSTATYTAPGEPWDGDATKVDPGAPIRALGFEPDLLPAAWLNFVLNLFGSWLNWFRSWHRSSDEEFIYPTTKTRVRAMTAAEAAPSGAGDGSSDWLFTHSGGAPLLLPVVDAAYAVVPIDVPSGCTITGVDIIVRSNGARSTPNGWIVSVYEQVESWVDPGGMTATLRGAAVEGGLSSGFDVITVTGLGAGFLLSAGSHAHVLVKGPTGSLGANDYLVAARVSFTDGGPRNA